MSPPTVTESLLYHVIVVLKIQASSTVYNNEHCLVTLRYTWYICNAVSLQTHMKEERSSVTCESEVNELSGQHPHVTPALLRYRSATTSHPSSHSFLAWFSSTAIVTSLTVRISFCFQSRKYNAVMSCSTKPSLQKSVTGTCRHLFLLQFLMFAELLIVKQFISPLFHSHSIHRHEILYSLWHHSLGRITADIG